MVMSHDPRSKFQIFFALILYLTLGKVTKFQVEKLFTSEVISQKPHGGGGGGGTVPLGLTQKYSNENCQTLPTSSEDSCDLESPSQGGQTP